MYEDVREFINFIDIFKKELQKTLWEVTWEKEFSPLPNELSSTERNQGTGILLHLGWLLSDYNDYPYTIKLKELVSILRDVVEVIESITE